VDEASHSCSNTWRQVIEHFSLSRTVGLTATPERLDGKGLGDIYESMVEGPDTSWLIENDYLSRYELFTPTTPDLSSVPNQCGDFADDQSAGIMDNPRITGDAIREYRKHCDNAPAVAFCVSVVHSQNVARSFSDAGITAVHLDGTTSKSVRRAAVEDYRRGNIKVLTSVDLFNEGFDLPAIVAAIQLRPTQSLAMCRQQIGRALRKFSCKDHAIILDHAGNFDRHGFPDDPIKWSLESKRRKTRDKQEQDIKVRKCPDCYMQHRPADVCPSCGFVYPVIPREIEHVDGDLVRVIRGQAHKKKVDLDVIIAVTQKDRVALEKLAQERGYKNPSVWAEIRLASRQKRKPDYKLAMSRRSLYV
jgi:superfamily II DNA or RNA helicase